jgi:WD40 repeat protein
MQESRLSLRRVIGTTCSTPTGFDTVNSSFAYIAGGAVVVVDVDGDRYTQRFYRARPTAVPLHALLPLQNAPSTPSSTPKANDSRNRVAPGIRDSPYNGLDWTDSPSSKTWTSRERIKAATCLALSRDGRFLAVGETGYAPRVLIFNLLDSSSDIPLVSISEHTFGVKAVAWSQDTRYMASLGAANDGFLYLWKIDARTGAAKLFQQNRCTSYVSGMVWMGSNLITFGVRHVKAWRVEDAQSVSPVKQKFAGDLVPAPQGPQKTLPGRNILLGSLLNANFTCAAVVDEARAILCSEMGDVCLLDDDGKQMKLSKVLNADYSISSITVREGTAYIGGKAGQFATLSVEGILAGDPDSVVSTTQPSTGLVALGFLTDNLVTIDAKHSIDIWSPSYIPGQTTDDAAHIAIPGHGDAILGTEVLPRPNDIGAAFITWSGTGKVMFWDMDGQVKSSLDVPMEQADPGTDLGLVNQLTVVRVAKGGTLLVAADRLGVMRVIDVATKECLLDTKAHSSDCQVIAMYEDDSRLLMASCGRDRTTQLFHRSSNGVVEHFQTLEFAAKVIQVLIPSDDKIITCSLDRTVQVHDLVSKEGEPDAMAAIPAKVISLKASPTSMTMGADEKTVFVSLLDRSICQYELGTGRLLATFKCVDEGGVESAVLESLTTGQSFGKDFLLGISNTDKSVRLYDAQSGSFLGREWGHTEAINGVALVDDEDGTRKIVSVGSDGTMMLWTLDLQDPSPGSMSRDPSPVKDGISASTRPPLRRVLSKAELAEFQRPSPSAGRRSPPRPLQRRASKYGLSSSILKTPLANLQTSPASVIAEGTPSQGTPSRRTSSGSRSGSPPVSPKSRVTRRPSLPALGTSARKKSSPNLRGFGTLNMATEQACRTLRAYRKKLSSTDPLSQDVLAELDQELRLTAAALGDRAIRSKAMNETVLSGLLDQYSERLVTMLDEKLRLSFAPRLDKDGRECESPGVDEDSRPRTAGGESTSPSP